jgi:hypothetical protein
LAQEHQMRGGQETLLLSLSGRNPTRQEWWLRTCSTEGACDIALCGSPGP